MTHSKRLTGLVALSAAAVAASGAIAGAAPNKATARPAAEHIPHAVHNVHLTYSAGPTVTPTSSSGSGSGAIVHGAKAAKLVTIFDGLKREPRSYVHCDIAGGPTTTVRFVGPHHTWIVTEAACTNLMVKRDGKALPTLLPTKAWTAAVDGDLGR